MFYKKKKKKTVTYSHKKVGNLYIVYEITNFQSIGTYPTLKNTLSGDVKLTKNADMTSIDILDMELDFMEKDFTHTLVVELEEML